MKLMVIPSWYSTRPNSSVGTPFKEQTKALIREGIDASILYADLDIIDWRNKPLTIFPKHIYAIEDGIPTFRLRGIFPPKVSLAILNAWGKRYESLYDDYINEKGRPDVIHGRSFYGAYIAMRLSKKYEIPYVVSEHSSALAEGNIRPYLLDVIREVYTNANARVAISLGIKKRMEAFTKAEIDVIPNFINTDYFKPKAQKQRTEVIRFLSLGGLVPRKKVDIQIKAFAELEKQGRKNIQLNIGGWGREEANLKAQVNDHGLADKVNFLGKLERPAVKEALENTDVFLMTSEYEPFGVVLIEATSMGLPVVATACDGAKDVINLSLIHI